MIADRIASRRRRRRLFVLVPVPHLGPNVDWKKDGPAFDKAYVEAQLKGHEETVALFQAYANGGDNARIKQFAKDLLPTLQMHLEHVRKIKV